MSRERVYRKFSESFRVQAVGRLRESDNVVALCRELGISRQLLYQWRDRLDAEQGKVDPAVVTESQLRHEIVKLKAVACGEDDASGFFAGCLGKDRGSAPGQYRLWRNGIYEQVREVMPQGTLGVEPMCRLAGVSRAGFYRFLVERHPHEEEMEVRSAIQQIVVEPRHRYGYRRVTAELRRRGMAVNHKRVARLMRADNLLAIQPKTFVVTTESEHGFEVYLNLAKRMNLSGINQLWVADITFIRLRSEFVYLAVILDAFSRKVVGWELGRTLTARLAVAALEKAIAERRPAAGLVHHSDRGVQYASGEYIGVLAHHQMLPSMSRPANPYDNRVPQRQVFVAGVKRQLRELYEDPEAGGGPCQHVPRYRRSARPHRRVHRPVLQSAAAALRARISDSGRVRSLGSTRVRLARSEHKFFQAWGDLSIEWKSKRGAA